jgi:hypothetical protein
MLRLHRGPISPTDVGVVTSVRAVDLSVQGDECDLWHRDSFHAAGEGGSEWLPGH